ncbi:hypothetical protein TBK1r_63380 [Stieleria magnilauensis]|uniref:Uncharacterized protein n=1 Tax=Stieleria magnilauensis TaxID=2527963 RepID=A0ABX5Y5B8_9BACT|nr:hypothetical protein TBK1r_63380 [Planctomycetes bacterium TBK1r]
MGCFLLAAGREPSGLSRSNPTVRASPSGGTTGHLDSDQGPNLADFPTHFPGKSMAFCGSSRVSHCVGVAATSHWTSRDDCACKRLDRNLRF